LKKKVLVGRNGRRVENVFAKRKKGDTGLNAGRLKPSAIALTDLFEQGASLTYELGLMDKLRTGGSGMSLWGKGGQPTWHRRYKISIKAAKGAKRNYNPKEQLSKVNQTVITTRTKKYGEKHAKKRMIGEGQEYSPQKLKGSRGHFAATPCTRRG